MWVGMPLCSVSPSLFTCSLGSPDIFDPPSPALQVASEGSAVRIRNPFSLLLYILRRVLNPCFSALVSKMEIPVAPSRGGCARDSAQHLGFARGEHPVGGCCYCSTKQCARHLAGNTSKHVRVTASALETTRTHTRRPDAEEHVKCFGTDRQTSDPGDSLLAWLLFGGLDFRSGGLCSWGLFFSSN